MTSFTWTNFFQTTLAAPAASNATTLTVASQANLPASIPAGSNFPVILRDAATGLIFEIAYATAVSGNVLTVTRAQESTLAQTWSIGDFIMSGVTAGQLSAIAAGGQLQPYDVSGGTAGKMTDSQIVLLYIAPRTVTFPANLAGSQGTLLTAPAAALSLSVTVASTAVATMSFAASSANATFTTVNGAGFTVNAGQLLEVVAPATVDTAAANLSFTFAGTI